MDSPAVAFRSGFRLKSTTFLRPRQPSEAHGQINERQRTVALDLQCSRGMYGVHPGTLRSVARPLPVRAAVTFTVYFTPLHKYLRRRQAQDGRQGVGTTLSHFVQAIDPILGPYSQALDRIGATGIMV